MTWIWIDLGRKLDRGLDEYFHGFRIGIWIRIWIDLGRYRDEDLDGFAEKVAFGYPNTYPNP